MQSQIVYTFENSISTAGSQIISTILAFIPSLIGAVVLFLIGILLSNWAKKLVEKLLQLTKLDKLFTNPAIKEFLKNAQITQKMEVVIGEVVRWLIIILFFMASMNILGLTPVVDFLNTIFAYVPNILAATMILLIGVVLAGVLEKLAKGSLGSVDLSLSRFMGKFVSYSIMVITSLAAISQLGIAQNFIEAIFTGFIATIVLALGLGFGLGSKDIIKSILERWYDNYLKK